jgi:hypothetical protein
MPSARNERYQAKRLRGELKKSHGTGRIKNDTLMRVSSPNPDRMTGEFVSQLIIFAKLDPQPHDA